MEDDYEYLIVRAQKESQEEQRSRYKGYGKRKFRAVQTLYLISALLWVALVLMLNLYRTSCGGYFILLAPLVIFFIGFANTGGVSARTEESMLTTNYISVALLVVLPLLAWGTTNYATDSAGRRDFITTIVVALVLAMLSLVNIWVPQKWFPLVRHIKSVLQTMSLTLIIFALYNYYIYHVYISGVVADS